MSSLLSRTKPGYQNRPTRGKKAVPEVVRAYVALGYIAGPLKTFEYDIAIIGGGLVGAAIGWGIAPSRPRIAILDEGDLALRASRGNFALVWVQGKGAGMPRYGM